MIRAFQFFQIEVCTNPERERGNLAISSLALRVRIGRILPAFKNRFALAQRRVPKFLTNFATTRLRSFRGFGCGVGWVGWFTSDPFLIHLSANYGGTLGSVQQLLEWCFPQVSVPVGLNALSARDIVRC